MIDSAVSDFLLGKMTFLILFVAVLLGWAFLTMSRPKGNSGAEQKSTDSKSENPSRPAGRGED